MYIVDLQSARQGGWNPGSDLSSAELQACYLTSLGLDVLVGKMVPSQGQNVFTYAHLFRWHLMG
jgi:hypothetical protein